MSIPEADVIPLHDRSERPTTPPGPGDDGSIRGCQGLENMAIALAGIRDHVEWQTECMVTIAKKFGLKLPPPPRSHRK